MDNKNGTCHYLREGEEYRCGILQRAKEKEEAQKLKHQQEHTGAIHVSSSAVRFTPL